MSANFLRIAIAHISHCVITFSRSVDAKTDRDLKLVSLPTLWWWLDIETWCPRTTRILPSLLEGWRKRKKHSPSSEPYDAYLSSAAGMLAQWLLTAGFSILRRFPMIAWKRGTLSWIWIEGNKRNIDKYLKSTRAIGREIYCSRYRRWYIVS